ncbi:MAG: hypothetical protein QOJ33_595 [Chloroflexota bacterium]|nr:hypothetical protein [Chloroflexota bacterium]
MKRLLIALGAAGALFAGAVVSAAPNASPIAVPAGAIGSGSTASAPAANTGAVATQAANPTVVAAPAAPPVPGNANGCVGFAVSTTAHETQQMFGQGFGAYAKSLGQNPGKAIQTYATGACGKH